MTNRGKQMTRMSLTALLMAGTAMSTGGAWAQAQTGADLPDDDRVDGRPLRGPEADRIGQGEHPAERADRRARRGPDGQRAVAPQGAGEGREEDEPTADGQERAGPVHGRAGGREADEDEPRGVDGDEREHEPPPPRDEGGQRPTREQGPQAGADEGHVHRRVPSRDRPVRHLEGHAERADRVEQILTADDRLKGVRVAGYAAPLPLDAIPVTVDAGGMVVIGAA